jgi:hypothetical protein
VRPWKDTDGNWYVTIATDGCNSTTKKVPCGAGGQLDLWTSPRLHGAGADWKHVDRGFLPRGMFRSNRTALTGHGDANWEDRELVTAGYFGGIPGDPKGGKTRVITNNDQSDTGSGTTMFFVGFQSSGGAFVDKHGAACGISVYV